WVLTAGASWCGAPRRAPLLRVVGCRSGGKLKLIDQIELEPVQARFLKTLGPSRRQQRVLKIGVQSPPIPPGESRGSARGQQIIGVNPVLQDIGRRALVILIE